MTTFIGDFPCKMDDKGRVLFPSAFAKQLSEAADKRFVIKKDIFEPCLVLYPMDEWKSQIEIIRSKLNPYNREHNQFIRGFFKGTAELTLDSNNRILLPKRLLEKAEIDKDIYMAGQDGKIEIWAKEKYEKLDEDEEQFAQLAQKILGDTPLDIADNNE